jgi:hypothetical protein
MSYSKSTEPNNHIEIIRFTYLDSLVTF